MPSAFSHALVGGAIATALPRGAPRGSPWLLAALAVAPDLDVIGLYGGIPYSHALGHRGFTHSLVFAFLLGLAAWPAWRTLPPREAARAWLVCSLAVASHGFLDLFTDAGLGVGLWLPFEDARYFAPWRPIRTSPLSARAFFSGSGLPVLRNEAIWIGLPTGLALVGVWAWRRTRGEHVEEEST